ncbi:PREDICTED: MOB kinase activator-like 4 [Acropora digitifera]|uniref:MOB kinase activator-like 4 n=1 Tax=Acropora digitifera TaxID=70779 RepID=UPI00077A474E|nr:PREDICTED: MOB kinase activator-like 4 [Acropora digitifera]
MAAADVMSTIIRRNRPGTKASIVALRISPNYIVYIIQGNFQCPAIDYTRHTLDGAASLLNSNKYFPSRVSIKDSSVAKLGSVCRRVYRIFSHAFFHHRSIYDEFENETLLCKRFTTYVLKYDLMAKENLIVPMEDSSTPAPAEESRPGDNPVDNDA